MQRAANDWDRFYRHHDAPWRGERPVADLLPLLGDGPVLELGSGNGKLLRPLLAAGIDAVGLDISFNVLQRTPGILADASCLPFVDKAFTAVLDIHCTGHLLEEGRAAAAREIARVLAPGGHVVVERLLPRDLRAQNGEVVEAGTRRLQDGRTTHFCTAADIAREHAGLRLVDERVHERRTRYDGQDVTRASVRVVLQKH